MWGVMMQNSDAYLFGQILGTRSFLLKDGFLKPDEYSEIQESYFLPGGETGTAATVLSSLGVSVRMNGTWIGTEVAPMLKAFYADKPVDLSSLHYMDDDPGVMDYVVIADFQRKTLVEYPGGSGLGRMPCGSDRSVFPGGVFASC